MVLCILVYTTVYTLNLKSNMTVDKFLSELEQQKVPFKTFVQKERDDAQAGWQKRLRAAIRAAKTESDWLTILTTVTNGRPSLDVPPPLHLSTRPRTGLQSQP